MVPNDGDEQRGQDGAVDDGGVPVVKRKNDRVRGVCEGPVNNDEQKWRREMV